LFIMQLLSLSLFFVFLILNSSNLPQFLPRHQFPTLIQSRRTIWSATDDVHI
jgi:hypothetical protein